MAASRNLMAHDADYVLYFLEACDEEEPLSVREIARRCALTSKRVRAACLRLARQGKILDKALARPARYVLKRKVKK